jgi:hypothetical protein
MEEKMAEMQKWVDKKKQKINIIKWLNMTYVPNINIQSWIQSIQVTEEHIEILIEQNMIKTISAIINKKLETKSNQVSVEPDSNVWNPLEQNILLNDCTVNIHKGFVSRKPLELLNYGYASVSTPVETSTKESLSVEQLQYKYGIIFDTLVADCEGFLESFFDENPNLYSQLHTVIFEADYPNKCNYDKIRSTLKNNGFNELVHGFQNVYKK